MYSVQMWKQTCISGYNGTHCFFVLVRESCDQVLEWCCLWQLQQIKCVSECHEMLKKSIEVWVDVHGNSISVVSTVQVGQGSEQHQNHFLGQKHESIRKLYT